MPGTSVDAELMRFPTGMTAIYVENHAAPVVALQVWVRVGSGDEQPGEAGLAHVHEHMLFKGTERRAVGEIAREVESMGGTINAWTSFDQTVYHVVVPSRFASEGLDVLLDAICNSAFDPEELERELEVIQEEIRRGDDMPTRVLSRNLFATAYEEHPYGNPVIGTHESVAAFTRDDILRFYHRWYRPSNITLVVVGDVDRDVVEAAVTGEFGSAVDEAPARDPRPQEPPQAELRTSVEFRDIQDGHLNVAFHVPDLAAEDTAALEVLSILLGQGESSILFEEVQRRSRLTNEVYAYLYTPAEPGILLLGASFRGGDDPVDPLEVLRAVLLQVAMLRYRELSRTDIQRAVNILESDTIYQRQTVQGVAQRLGYFHTVAGGVEFESRFLELARRVTAADLQAVAARYLTPENLTVGFMLPEAAEERDLSREVIGHDVRRVFAALDREFGPLDLNGDERGTIRHQFDNGLVAIIQPDTTAPMFSVRAAVMGGLLAEDQTNAGISNLLAHLLTSGTSTLTASALALEVDSLAASLSGFSGRNTVGLRMTALSRDFESALGLFSSALLDSQLPADELERVRHEALADIAAQQDNIAGSTFRLFNERAYSGHPYALSVIGTAESVGGVDREEILEFYHRLVEPGRMVVSVVGDVEPSRVIRTLGALFGGDASSEPRRPAARPEPTQIDEPAVVFEVRDRQQTHVVLGYQTESMFGTHRHALDVLGVILGGQGGRLFLELRDRQSLAYTVNAYSNCGLDAGTFSFYIATSPAKVAAALDGIRAEVERVVGEGVTDEEVERAQRYLIGRRDIALQRQSARAGYFTFDEIYGAGYEYGYEYDTRIGRVTAASVQAAAAAYFAPEREILAVIGPSAPEDDAPADVPQD